MFRLVYLIWIAGFVVLAAVASSQLLFGRHAAPMNRWVNQLAVSALWPFALLTRSGRESIRGRFGGPQ